MNRCNHLAKGQIFNCAIGAIQNLTQTGIQSIIRAVIQRVIQNVIQSVIQSVIWGKSDVYSKTR